MVRLRNSSHLLTKMMRSNREKAVVAFLIIAAGFFLFGEYRARTAAQVQPITYPQLITALGSAVPNPRFKTKQQIIVFLISDIKKRKVDKPLTPDREEDLRQAGATDELIEVIRA